MSENEDNKYEIDNIIESGYIDGLRQKYEAADPEPVVSESTASEPSAGFFRAFKKNRIKNSKGNIMDTPTAQGTGYPENSKTDAAVKADVAGLNKAEDEPAERHTGAGDSAIPDAEDLFSYFAEISSELKAAKNEITRPISESINNEPERIDLYDVLVEAAAEPVSDQAYPGPEDTAAENCMDGDEIPEPVEITAVPVEPQNELSSAQREDGIETPDGPGEAQIKLPAGEDKKAAVADDVEENPEPVEGSSAETVESPDGPGPAEALDTNNVESEKTKTSNDDGSKSAAGQEDIPGTKPEETQANISDGQTPAPAENGGNEPAANRADIPAPANSAPGPGEKPPETGPSMRVIYQAPEGRNPGFTASPYPAAQRTYPVYTPPETTEPAKPQPPAPKPEHDYLAHMRIIYEAPEESFQDDTGNKPSEIPPADTASTPAEPAPAWFASNQPAETDSPAGSLASLFADVKDKEAEPPKKGIKRLLYNMFPHKGDGFWESIRKIVLILSVITMLVCGGILLNTYIIAPNQSDRQAQKAINAKTNSSKTKDWSAAKDKYGNVDFPMGMQLKYADLYAINKDFAGWLEIPGAGVDMPIVKGKDNEVYLKKTFYGEKSKYGCVFADFRNELLNPNRNTILYGHNMSYDDLMFGKLEIYRDINKFKAAPLVRFNTLYRDYKWKIYAVIITNSEPKDDNGYLFDYNFTELGSDGAFQSYIQAVDERKLYTTGVDIRPTDRILTLSTCCYDFDDARFIVIARMVRSGESESVDVSKAVLNSSPHYPQVWYDTKGKSNPYGTAGRWYPN